MTGRITMRRPAGLTHQEAVNVVRKRIKDGEQYLISRHGGWFRPGGHGYTRELAHAGVFTAAEARSYIDVDGLSVVPVSAIGERVADAIAAAEQALENLRALRVRPAPLPVTPAGAAALGHALPEE